MPSFDTSDVAAQVAPPAAAQSPLATVSSLADLQNSLNRNKMFPLQFQGQQLQNTGQGIQNATNQQALMAAQYKTLQGLLAQTKDAGEVPGVIAMARDAGLITPDFASNVAGGGVAGLDPASVDTMRRQAVMAAGNEAELNANVGKSSIQNAGGNLTTINTRTGFGGATDVTRATGNAASIPTTLTPEAEAAPVDVVGPGGVVTTHRTSEFVTPTGQPQPGVAAPVTANPQVTATATAVGGAAPTLVGYTGGDGSHREIALGQIQNSNGSLKPNQKDAAGNQITDANGTLTVALAPRDMALLNATATNEADRANDLQTAFGGSAGRMALIQDLRATQGNFVSGPGAAKWAGIVTEANRLFPGLHLSSTAPATQAASEQVFAKIAEQLAAAPGSSLQIPVTNAGIAARDLANASPDKAPEANMEVLAQAAGNEALLQSKWRAWNAYTHHGGKDYNQFVGSFNPVADPRAFWEPYMTPLQRQTVLGSMSPQERAAYDANKAKLARAGF